MALLSFWGFIVFVSFCNEFFPFVPKKNKIFERFTKCCYIRGVVVAKSLGSPTMYTSFFMCPPNLMVPWPLLVRSLLALVKKKPNM